jgi:integrase/recombinase XerD
MNNSETSNHTSEFIESLKARKLSPATIKLRKYALKSFFDSCTVPLKDITEQDIVTYANSLDHLANETRQTRLSGLKQYFKYLEDKFIIFQNPIADFKIKAFHKPIPKTLTVEQVDVVMNSITSIRDRAFCELVYSTAARKSEALSIKLDDLEDDTVKLYGKGSKERVVPIGSTARQWLDLYLEKRKGDSEYLWLSRYKKQISPEVIDKLFRKIRETTGIECSCHTLRRSCATHCLNNGMNPAMLCKLLGHEKAETLKYYLKASVQELKETHAKRY